MAPHGTREDQPSLESLVGLDADLHLNAKKGLLRFNTCGSVDDGKSTLIGRLLYESKTLFDDELLALEADSKRVGTRPGERSVREALQQRMLRCRLDLEPETRADASRGGDTAVIDMGGSLDPVETGDLDVDYCCAVRLHPDPERPDR